MVKSIFILVRLTVALAIAAIVGSAWWSIIARTGNSQVAVLLVLVGWIAMVIFAISIRRHAAAWVFGSH